MSRLSDRRESRPDEHTAGGRMPVRLGDSDIARLVGQKKILPDNFMGSFLPKPKAGHKESQFDLTGKDNDAFRLVVPPASPAGATRGGTHSRSVT